MLSRLALSLSPLRFAPSAISHQPTGAGALEDDPGGCLLGAREGAQKAQENATGVSDGGNDQGVRYVAPEL
ncbi:uncharacterized protein SPSK_10219 [Sporothrix schenckii 1099-18]|uniref:Uncharacterized protein n=1 Tax=Sporothrix schenckii 1099-18 TaxID=1397361 RepID=A0A0F2MBT5_SPOSC|nr:uncharacterized protein SPSK_10219 [Sporothrix schenckii 1099-18]KJR85621.1 hypothetical protein SPSK_10219 [Sporothrix schenckii 1099-18]